MSPDRIKISMRFNPSLPNEMWLSSDHPVAPDEDAIEEFKKGFGLLVDAFKAINGGEGNGVQLSQVVQVEKLNGNGSLISHIRSCKDLVVLDTYKILVKGKPEEQKAYDEMFKKLSKKKSHHKTKLP